MTLRELLDEMDGRDFVSIGTEIGGGFLFFCSVDEVGDMYDSREVVEHYPGRIPGEPPRTIIIIKGDERTSNPVISADYAEAVKAEPKPHIIDNHAADRLRSAIVGTAIRDSVNSRSKNRRANAFFKSEWGEYLVGLPADDVKRACLKCVEYRDWLEEKGCAKCKQNACRHHGKIRTYEPIPKNAKCPKEDGKE